MKTVTAVLLLFMLAAPMTAAQKSGKKKRAARDAQATVDSAAPRDTAPDADADSGNNNGFRFVFRRYPSLRFGNVLRVDFHLKFQGDFRDNDPDLERPLFDLNRTRVGIEGRFLRDFEFEVEREIREEISRGNFDNPQHPWRDVYVNFRRFRDFQLQVGKFKVPFSLEQLTGPTRLDFVYRSRLADQIAPGRDLGLKLHGRFFERGLNYEVGIFKQDGENARASAVAEVNEFTAIREEAPSGQRAFAGRLTGAPLRLLPLPATLQDAHLGIAVVSTTVPPGFGREGLKSLRGRMITGHTFFPRLFTHGQRLRLGTEFAWLPGPFSLKGEFTHVSDQRLGQGIRGNDLPDLITRAWYVSGTWVVTGDPKASVSEPRREFIFGRGIGAVELGARFEAIRFGSADHIGAPSRGNRAANVLGNSDRIWTVGVNWYVNRWVKIQFNGVHEKIEDFLHPERVPSGFAGTEAFWTKVVRLQFVL